MSDSGAQSALQWAHEYDGYRRLAASPEKLGKLIHPARNSCRSHGVVPDWCGVDFLRGWAFFLVRADRHSGGDTLGEEWIAVLDALGRHPDATSSDRPPVAIPRLGVSTRTSRPTLSTRPKMHRDAGFLEAKQHRLHESHVASINAFVDRIAMERGSTVPHVDPDSGGARAKVLFVLESPAGPAALGSGMLSADNDDETAKNIWNAYRDSGMPRGYGLHWNAVPWYLGDGKKNKTPSAGQVEQGRHYLLGLLDLAPEVRVILAMGKKAQKSLAGATSALMDRSILLVECPHPGPIPAGVTGGLSLLRVREAFEAALAVADADEAGSTEVHTDD